MSGKFAEIIEMLEKADEIFNSGGQISEEAKKLWDAGIERLAAAIWMCEREEDKAL